MKQEITGLSELGQLLRRRRAQLTPAQAGLSSHGGRPRRVPGLRREEVAELAGISSDYYARFEQGRLAPTQEIMDQLTRVLGLTPDEADYAAQLVGHQPKRRRRPRSHVLPAPLQATLTGLEGCPVLVMNRRLDILGWNPLTAELLMDFGRIPSPQRNYIRLLFMDPQFRARYADWETVARTATAILRMNTADDPTDPDFAKLVGELTLNDQRFSTWWAQRHVLRQDFGTKRILHPLVGELVLHWNSFTYTATPDIQMALWSPEPGSPSQERLERLQKIVGEEGS